MSEEARLTTSLETGMVDPARFGHRDHVRVAWYLLTHDDEANATRRFAGALRRLTQAIGRPEKYHATMTVAWMRVVAHCLALDRQAGIEQTDFDAFEHRHPVVRDKTALRHHYSEALLNSAEARAGFVTPDLDPLPAPYEPSGR